MEKKYKIIFLTILLLGLSRLPSFADAADKKPATDVDLLWESSTYVPLWYEGKALAPAQAIVKITAVPYTTASGKIISPSKLVYDWNVNYKKNISASGIGKNYFLTQLKNYDDYFITLKLMDQSGALIVEKTIILSADRVKPKILFYEENPLEGERYNKSLDSEITLAGDEIAITAEPFFFSRADIEQLSFFWKMNGQSIESEDYPNKIILKRGEESGQSSLSLEINANINVLQSARNILKIIY